MTVVEARFALEDADEDKDKDKAAIPAEFRGAIYVDGRKLDNTSTAPPG